LTDNANKEVEVYAYVAKGSYDETMWQFLETKQRFIDQFLSGNVAEDSVSDIDGSADSFGEARAMSSDNPLAIEMAEVQNELSRLESLYRGHIDDQRQLALKKNRAIASIESYRKNIGFLEKAIDKRLETKGNKFSMVIGNDSFTERAKAGESLAGRLIDLVEGRERYRESIKVGEFAGFDLRAKEEEFVGSVYVNLSVVDRETKYAVAGFGRTTVDELKEASKSGFIMQLENGIRKLDASLENFKESVARDQNVIEESNQRIGQPFEYMAILKEKREKLDSIREELERQGQSPAAELQEQGSEPEGDAVQAAAPLTPLADPANLRTELGTKLPGFEEMLDSETVRIVTPEQADVIIQALDTASSSESVTGDQLDVKKSEDGRLQGFILPNGKVYLVEGNIEKGKAWGVLSHEIGVHAAQLMQSDSGFIRLLQTIEARKNEQSATGEAIRAAMSRVPKGTKAEHVTEEALAYLVEAAPQVGIVRRFFALLKNILVKMGLDPKWFTIADLSALAETALRRETLQRKPKKNTGVKASFAGPSSTTAGLDQAKQMRQAQKPRREIWNETGWWEITPGQWSYEIDDSMSTVTMRDGVLRNALKHPKLFEQYPVLKDVQVKFKDLGDTQRGAFSPKNNLISINSNFPSELQRSTLQHEVQHIIQEQEGSSTGGSFDVNDTLAQDKYWRRTGEIEARLVQKRLNMPPAQRKAVPPWVTMRRMLTAEGLLKAGQRVEDVLISEKHKEQNVEKDDTRHSVSGAHEILTKHGQAAKDFDQDLHEAKDEVLSREKQDSSFLHRVYSTAEYYFGKFSPAAGRVVEHALRKNDIKFEYQAKVFNGDGKDLDFIKAGAEFQKQFPADYKRANEYLVEVGRTYQGFTLQKEGQAWQVLDPTGEVVVDEVTGELQSFETESDAIAAMINSEKAHVLDIGYSEKAAEYVAMFRRVSNRSFDIMAEEMRGIDTERIRAGVPELLNSDENAGKRWGLFEQGKRNPVARYASEKEAIESLEEASRVVSYLVYGSRAVAGKQVPYKKAFANQLAAERYAKRIQGKLKTQKKFGQLKMRKLTDAELRPKTLQDMIAEMGDLRGVYFPRIRNSGAYILKAFKKDHDPFRQSFDVPFVDPEQGKTKTGQLVRKMISMGTPIGRKIAELQKEGYRIEVTKDESISEDVFEASKLTASLEAILSQTFVGQEKETEGELKASQIVNQLLTLQVADMIKGRGFLSSRMSRAEQHWQGYETDANVAMITAGQNISGGMAKRETAKNMILAMSGKDYSWQQYKIEVAKPVYEDWEQIVNERRVDPGKQKNLWKDTRDLIVEVLRNDEQLDRIVGTMRGLAVIKFLGFRVSSAVVNLTNMVLGVPATISSLSGLGLPGSLRMIGVSSMRYAEMLGKKNIGKEDRQVFDYLMSKGWDSAQFNMEAAQMLRTKLGRKYDKFADMAMMMFGAVERTNRAVTIHAAYKALKSQSEWAKGGEIPAPAFEQLMQEAHHISDRAHGIYNKATAPKWTHGQGNPLKLFYTFQKFSHSYLLNAMEMGFDRKDYKNAAYLLLSPSILAGAGASLPIAGLLQIMQAFGIGGDDPEESLYDWVASIFGSDAIVRQGIAGAMGINIKSSLSMNFAIPTSLKDLGGAPWAMVTDAIDAGAYLKEGEQMRALEKLLPTGLGNPAKALREYGEGITTGGSSPVFYGDEPLKASGIDAIVRALSFNPARLSGIREKIWNEKEVAHKYSDLRAEIYSEWRKNYIVNPAGRTKKDEVELIAMVMDFNRKVAASGRNDIKPISRKSIQTMLKRAATPNIRERSRAAE